MTHIAKIIFNSIILFLLTIYSTNAQSRKLISGSLVGLKELSTFNITFSYDSITIGGTNTPEKEYLTKKKTAWDLKDPEIGEKIISQWYDDRKRLYEPNFIKQFEDYSGKKHDPNSTTTLILKTRNVEGGWYVGVLEAQGEIAGEMWIVESANTEKVIAVISFQSIKGKPNLPVGDINMTKRIASAYNNAGYILGHYIRRKSK